MNLVHLLRMGLRRTSEQLSERMGEIVGRSERRSDYSTLAKENIQALEDLLIQADVGITATEQIVSAIHATKCHDSSSLRVIVKDEVLRILERTQSSMSDETEVGVVLVVGVNGTGKTTTVGKLAKRLREKGRHPVICAADTFRAAAVDQLDVWARRAGVEIVKAGPGADPAAVVFEAIQAGRKNSRDVVIVDTAGRLHTRVNLMRELEKIRRVVARELKEETYEVLLVLDATVGQNGLAQAREFLARVAVSGIVLTKLDGTAKGGIAVTIASELGLPIRYIGIGEGLDDLLPFLAEDYVDVLFEDAWR